MDKIKKNYSLKLLRGIKNVTQEEMGNLLGITITTYNRKENGISKFTLDEGKKISEYLGESIETIFFNN